MIFFSLNSWFQECCQMNVNTFCLTDEGFIAFIIFFTSVFTQFILLNFVDIKFSAHELNTLHEHLSSSLGFSGISVTRFLVLCLMIWRLLFVLLSFVFWPLYCLSFELQFLIGFFGIFKLFWNLFFFVNYKCSLRMKWVDRTNIKRRLERTTSV